MSISVTCPDCEHTFSVKDEYAGKRGKCPRCNGVFRAVPTEAVDAEIPAVLAARSGVALGAAATAGSSVASGSLAIDPNGARPSAAGKAGKKSGGRKKKSARRDPDAPAMPVWGWITLAVVLAAGFVGGGLVYMARAKDAVKIAERVDDGSEAEATKQKLLDEIKGLEDEVTKLKADLVAAEKAIGSKPKEKDPFGEIEKRVVPGAVKIIPYVNDQPGEKTATGFLLDVNGKTLIATTHRVCEGATKLGVKLVTGTEYEVEGIVAASDKKDIAILKPKGDMPGSKPLTIAENAQLHRGDTVYAIGNPARQEFTTSRGVVTRIVTQDKYFDENPMFDIALRRETAANPEYIEHDARIFGGDYGGPLLNANLEVVGMNQVLITMRLNDGRSIVQTYGAAKRISEIKALAATATDAIKPYPPAAKEDKQPEPKDDATPPDDKDDEANPDEVKPDADGDDAPAEEPKEDETPEPEDLAGKIDALFTECDGFDWKPTSGEQYGKLCDIARRVTEAKLLTDGDAGKEAATEAADKVLKRLGEAGWGTTEVEAVNKLAAALEPSEDAGICFVGKVLGATNFNDSPSLIFLVEGTESACIVPSEKATEIPQGTRGIVLGKFASAQKLKMKNPQDNKEYTATLVKSKGLVTLK